jgi:hypothetical protein
METEAGFMGFNFKIIFFVELLISKRINLRAKSPLALCFPQINNTIYTHEKIL